jgi:hypothetical protein
MHTIITEFYNKIKLFLEANLVELGVSFIIVFVGISSFLLGEYRVKSSKVETGIIIENRGVGEGEVSTSTSKSGLNKEKVGREGEVVASKSGKRYYFPWCGGVTRISEKNKIYFASALEAQKSGLTLASGCK